MVWGVFSANGKAELVMVERTMKSKDYQSMLQEHLLPFGPLLGGENWMFVQDNAPCHASQNTSTWLIRNKVKAMKWPPRSPDINPIENLWGILVRGVYAHGKQFSTVNELKVAICESWAAIGRDTLQNLIDSMQNRVFEVIKANGGSTKY